MEIKGVLFCDILISAWGRKLCVTGSSLGGADHGLGQEGTPTGLERRSMSGDTSEACCQGKLSYLATSTPLLYTQRHTYACTHTHTFPPPLRDMERQEDW